MWTDVLLILDATLRISVPFVLAAMGGIFAERSGVIDFGLEGKMLGGAFVAATVAHLTQSAWWGLLGSIGIGIIFSMIHGYASVSKRGNQVVSCVAINIFAMGLTVVLANAWFHMGGKTPQLPKEARFMSIELPFAEEFRNIPIIGEIYYELISGPRIFTFPLRRQRQMCISDGRRRAPSVPKYRASMAVRRRLLNGRWFSQNFRPASKD